MIGPLILQIYLKNSFLDERIISCQIKIIGLISCKRYIGKFLIVENLIVQPAKEILIRSFYDIQNLYIEKFFALIITKRKIKSHPMAQLCNRVAYL